MRKLGIAGLCIGCILLLSGCNENAEMFEEESESVKEYVESLSAEENSMMAEASEESAEEDAEVDAEAVEEPETWEDQGEEILRRLMTVDLSFAEEATITGDWDSVVRLAELPEYDITMYGYNDDEFSGRGVAIQIGEDVNYFDWVYIAPRFILPEMYWDDGKKQLQVALNIYTGTGVGAQELHILQQYETGTLSDNVLDIRTYSEMLAERLDYTYDNETKELIILDKREGSKLFQTTLSCAEGAVVEGIWAGNISNFILGDELWLEFTPGYHLAGRVMTEYEEMVPLKAQIQLESGEENRFALGKIYNSQFAVFFENLLYQELLNQLDNQCILPDGRLAYGTTNLEGVDPFPNSVAFADVDNDGSEELLASVGGTCMADMGLYAYQYEEEERIPKSDACGCMGESLIFQGLCRE